MSVTGCEYTPMLMGRPNCSMTVKGSWWRPTISIPNTRSDGARRTGAAIAAVTIAARAETATTSATRPRNVHHRGDDQQGQNLIPSELNPPGVTGSTGGSGGTGSPTSTGNDERPISPSALGYFGGLFSNFGGPKEEVTTFDREPPRPNLTAPPSGYQTPSPAQPYGLTKKKDRATVKPSDPAVGAN